MNLPKQPTFSAGEYLVGTLDVLDIPGEECAGRGRVGVAATVLDVFSDLCASGTCLASAEVETTISVTRGEDSGAGIGERASAGRKMGLLSSFLRIKIFPKCFRI